MGQHYNIQWLTETFEAGKNIKYLFFWGHTNPKDETAGNFCFSQWYPSPFIVDCVMYKTAEHWMMAKKAELFGDWRNREQIINSNTPKEAKELGRNVLGYDDAMWNKHKYEIVKLGNIHKFNQNPDFLNYLLQTEGRVLVEASPVDTIWGIGLSKDSTDVDNIYAWRGENLLGFALMEVRDLLKELGQFSATDLPLPPPWLAFPEISPMDMFWRMGKGEQYLSDFMLNYEKLSDLEKTTYRLCHPQPFEWEEFY